MEAALYHVAQITIFLLGIIAVGLSFYYIHFFRAARKSHKLAATMQLFLVEQAISAFGVLAFSFSSLCGSLGGLPLSEWNAIPPFPAILIRATMFGAMILSTTKLSIEVARIGRTEDQ